ncbi:alpha-L-fucosidase [Blautia massiliensis]|nr:alpha-L-fucosidase [Blautia massiliensis (ex Durand et al. 2017)]
MADTKQQWYKDAKYGLFIHWGLYSILAGEWKDPKTGEVTKTDRIAEWIENNLNIDKEDYRKLKDEFHPDKFDADMFVKRAKEQWGVKYIVLTSKHHEGFAMYDSKVSDFNVVKAAGRDILRELSDACKKYDMTMGMLYTQGFSYKLFGRSSAYGVILLVLGVVLSLITNHLFREDKDLAM